MCGCRAGGRAAREIVRHPGAVALLVIDQDGGVLLVRQYRRPPDRQLLEIPAGTREAGEDAEACARARGAGGDRLSPPRTSSGWAASTPRPASAPSSWTATSAPTCGPADLQPEEDEDLELERLSLDEAWAAAARGRDHRRQDAGGPAALRGAPRRPCRRQFEF